MPERVSLEKLARRALNGEREAVASLVGELQRPVYALALRMLWHRDDAEDATQEILVRVLTRLSQFDFNSRLTTWVYRVATNYLLDVKKSCAEQQRLSFSDFAEDLAAGLSTGPDEHERSILTQEVKIGCTLAMLQCLDRPHRIAYVLGEILGLPAPEAAEAMSLEPAAFRKRLQRARAAIEDFTRRHCGLVSAEAPCRCHRRVEHAERTGRVRATALEFAKDEISFVEARAVIQGVEEVRHVVELRRAANPGGPNLDFARLVASALDAPTRLQ